jgi:hypothetical protein
VRGTVSTTWSAFRSHCGHDIAADRQRRLKRKSYAARDAQRLFRQFHVFASLTHYALSSQDSKENLE